MEEGKYEVGSYLRKVRADISKSANSEYEIADQLDLMSIFENIQRLRAEMIEAKRLAADEAARPYIALIKELEEQYATMLKLGAK